MNFRYLLLAAVLGLSACNGSEISTNEKEADSTFSELENAKKQLGNLNAQLDAGKKVLAETTQNLAAVNGQRTAEERRRDELKSANDAAVAEADKRLKELTEAAEAKASDVARAQVDYAALVGEDGTGTKAGKIFEETKKLEGLQADVETKEKDRTNANDSLDDLLGKDRTGKTAGKVFDAQKELDDLIRSDPKNLGKIAEKKAELQSLQDDVGIEQGKLSTARNQLKDLLGDDLTGTTAGKIFDADQILAKLKSDAATEEARLTKAKKDLDDLVREDSLNPGEIAKARELRDDLKAEGEKLLSDARKGAARILAKASADTGRFDDAAKFLTDAGLNDEAVEMYKKAGKNDKAGDLLAAAGKSEEAIEQYKKAGSIDKAAALLTAAGKLEDAYKLYAPEDRVKEDKNAYKSHSYTTVAFDKVDEIPAVKRHSIQLDGKTIWLTAKAGHLIAYAQKDKTNPEAKRDPQAAVFYMSYTRDDLPKDKRPVMFFFNGGPGEASIWMHLGAFGPKKIKLDYPTLPPNAATGRYLDFPFVDNADSLVDKADLVFVDPIGDGYSHAITSDIKAHIDKDFWGVDVDAKVMRDFITRYINVNNRQISPKYLYGESYGGGIRVPVLTKLLLDAGTSNYEEDKSGKPAVVLAGSVFHSPILDFGSNCIDNASSPCAGFFPTYAMTTDAFGQSTARGKRTITDYMQEVRKFAKETNLPATKKVLDNTFSAFSQTDDGKAYIKELERFTGLSNSWSNGININPKGFMAVLKPEYTFNDYDMRMIIKGKVLYKFSYMEDPAFHKRIKEYLPEYFNFKNDSYYEASLSETTGSFRWDWSSRGGQTKTNSLDDIAKALNYAPDLKLMVTHGYFDGRTPTFQSELDLDKTVKINGKDVNLHDRIPLHNFEGGHMMYYVESELPKLKKTIVDFIDAPPYSPPTLVTEQKTTVLN